MLTSYRTIGDIDVAKELRQTRAEKSDSPLESLLAQALKAATNSMVPKGLDPAVWRSLEPDERLYIKDIQVEVSGEMREGVYQELARGYGAGDYRALLASRAANQARLKTPTELGSRELRPVGTAGFGGSLLRHLLFAIYQVSRDPEHDPRTAREYLRQELTNIWNFRLRLLEMLRFIVRESDSLPHWQTDTQAARLLLGSLENAGV